MNMTSTELTSKPTVLLPLYIRNLQSYNTGHDERSGHHDDKEENSDNNKAAAAATTTTTSNHVQVVGTASSAPSSLSLSRQQQQQQQQRQHQKQETINTNTKENKNTKKNASVLILIAKDDCVLLNRRSIHLRSHPGEVCFPGGKQDEEHDRNNVWNTALRETYEEVGLQFHIGDHGTTTRTTTTMDSTTDIGDTTHTTAATTPTSTPTPTPTTPITDSSPTTMNIPLIPLCVLPIVESKHGLIVSACVGYVPHYTSLQLSSYMQINPHEVQDVFWIPHLQWFLNFSTTSSNNPQFQLLVEQSVQWRGKPFIYREYLYREEVLQQVLDVPSSRAIEEGDKVAAVEGVQGKQTSPNTAANDNINKREFRITGLTAHFAHEAASIAFPPVSQQQQQQKQEQHQSQQPPSPPLKPLKPVPPNPSVTADVLATAPDAATTSTATTAATLIKAASEVVDTTTNYEASPATKSSGISQQEDNTVSSLMVSSSSRTTATSLEYQGYLYCRKDEDTNKKHPYWSQNYYVLSNTTKTLHQYDSQNQAQRKTQSATKKNRLLLSLVTSVNAMDINDGKEIDGQGTQDDDNKNNNVTNATSNTFPFRIVALEGRIVWTLATASSRDRDEWMDRIQKSMQHSPT